MEKAKDISLWVWFLCWLGIILSFFFVGIEEYRIELSVSRRGAYFSLVLLATTALLWVLFFVTDHKAHQQVGRGRNSKGIFLMSMAAGTILAVFTLLGIGFFTFIAPRLQ